LEKTEINMRYPSCTWKRRDNMLCRKETCQVARRCLETLGAGAT